MRFNSSTDLIEKTKEKDILALCKGTKRPLPSRRLNSRVRNVVLPHSK